MEKASGYSLLHRLLDWLGLPAETRNVCTTDLDDGATTTIRLMRYRDGRIAAKVVMVEDGAGELMGITAADREIAQLGAARLWDEASRRRTAPTITETPA
jgi:hypothetical protein